MASFLQGSQSNRGVPGRSIYDKQDAILKYQGLSEKEKLQAIAGHIRTSDREQRIRRNTTWYLMALYYQGYQNVDLNPGGDAFDVFEREDFYVENQFRRHVDAVVNMLSKAEGSVTTRPVSSKAADIAASRAASPILDMMKDNIGYDRAMTQKNFFKVLFGNAFIFTDYVVDKKYGTVINPKYSYDQVPDPTDPNGGTMLSKVPNGFETRNLGSEICVVASPLEVHVRPDIRGFENIPYLQWVTRQDIELLNYIYPGLGMAGGSNSVDADLAQQYLEILENLPGNILGDSLAFNRGASQVRKAELCRTWIQPCQFGGDRALESKFPDGVHVVTVEGRIVDYYPENLLDRWTHEVLIPTPASLLGDGLYDAMLMQDQINEMNSLIIQHMRYTTVAHKVYDATIVDPKDIANAPKNEWIPGRPSLDKNISQAVQQLSPGALSPDTFAWLGGVKGAMQDMSSAYDPSIGKGIGANTPYSQSVFLSERAQSRWQASMSYNRPELIRFHKNLLRIAQNDWVDERTKAVSDHTGAWTFQKFSQVDLAGDVDLILSNTDMMPRSRAEQIQGLQMLTTLAPLIPGLPPKQKLRIEEILGLPPDANPMSTQISRAYRNIEKIKAGQMIQPIPMVDDPVNQGPVFQDFLASEEGEDLATNQQPVWQAIYMFMQALAMMMPPPMPPEGEPGPGGAPAPKKEAKPAGGQPGQPGGGPNPGGQAQSPAVAPPLPPIPGPGPQPGL